MIKHNEIVLEYAFYISKSFTFKQSLLFSFCRVLKATTSFFVSSSLHNALYVAVNPSDPIFSEPKG